MFDSPYQSRIACIAFTVYLLLSAGTAFGQSYTFPPRLPPGHFLQDDANLLEMDDRLTLKALQNRIFAQTNTPLVVVTIDRVSDFTSHPGEIDALARAWFDHWAIGSETGHTGILLLVSYGDRQAQIELGSVWGTRWDRYCEQIIKGMLLSLSRLESGQQDVHRGQIVFNQGDASGILAATQALAGMAVQGPNGKIPSLGISARLLATPWMQTMQEWQSLSPLWGLWTLMLGLMSIVGGLVIRRYWQLLFLSGLVLVLGGFLPILLLLLPLVIAYGLFSKPRSRDHHSYADQISATTSPEHPFGVDRGGLFGNSGRLAKRRGSFRG